LGEKPASPAERIAAARRCLQVEAAALQKLAESLDAQFVAFLEALQGCTGRVVCSGMGKTGLVMRKLAATFSSTGTPSFFLHPVEALHGDLGAVCPGDVVLLASASGQTRELLDLALALSKRNIPVLALVGRLPSPLSQVATQSLELRVEEEACPWKLAPTTSTTVLMAMGDVLALGLMEARGFGEADFARLHPAGSLGEALRPVRERMVTGAARPLVDHRVPLREAVAEMSRKGLGIVGILDAEGRLCGCLTDGDLRRLVERGDFSEEVEVGRLSQKSPKTVPGELPLREVRQRLFEARITTLFVVDTERRVEGLIHIHQLNF
jgi:arabinose-5-phosphate isomerase